MMAAALLDKEQYNVQICAGQILPQLRDTTKLEFQFCDDTAASCSSRVVTLGSITSVFSSSTKCSLYDFICRLRGK